MSLYVLDTDILSLYRAGHPGVCWRVADRQYSELAITAMSVEEQLSGWYTLLRKVKGAQELAHAYQRLVDSVYFLAGWQILSYTEQAIARFDQLKKLKINIGKSDLRIAAITQQNEGTLVTRNLRDFRRVPGLPLENWAV